MIEEQPINSRIRSFKNEFIWIKGNQKPSTENKVLAQESKINFDKNFGDYVDSKLPYISGKPVALVQDMQRYKTTLDSSFTFAKERKRCIILDDSMMRYTGFFEKKSYFLNPRNPLSKDETIIDYEMDSEEEWNEQNGEDVAADNKQDEDEDDEVDKQIREEEQDDEDNKFIVPDDYLSASELNLSQSQRSSQIVQEIKERRKMLGNRYNRNNPGQNQHPYIITLNQLIPSSPVSSYSTGLNSYFKEFKAVAFPKDRQLPIRLKPLPDPVDEEEKISSKANNPFSLKSRLVELAKLMHGSFESKQKIIDDFHARFPDCSKKSIERKMIELFVKEKKDLDPNKRWYATESTLNELNLLNDPELTLVAEERLKVVVEEMNRLQEEQNRIKEEQNRTKEEQQRKREEARNLAKIEKHAQKEQERFEREKLKQAAAASRMQASSNMITPSKARVIQPTMDGLNAGEPSSLNANQ